MFFSSLSFRIFLGLYYDCLLDKNHVQKEKLVTSETLLNSVHLDESLTKSNIDFLFRLLFLLSFLKFNCCCRH